MDLGGFAVLVDFLGGFVACGGGFVGCCGGSVAWTDVLVGRGCRVGGLDVRVGPGPAVGEALVLGRAVRGVDVLMK